MFPTIEKTAMVSEVLTVAWVCYNLLLALSCGNQLGTGSAGKGTTLLQLQNKFSLKQLPPDNSI